MVKRLFDIFLSSIAILFLSPLLIFVSLILKFTGEKEVFYQQVRVGVGRRLFNILKFATMVKNSPSLAGGTLTLQNDPRVLPIGKILRKTKINELPQLINILKGDMSIVGPRPLVSEGEKNYSSDGSSVIRSVRPGLTGLGSLVLRDEEGYYAHRPDAVDFYISVISPFKESLELWYVENQSFGLDLKIIVLTAMSVLQPDFAVGEYFKHLPEMPNSMADSRNIQDQ
jgi:lipopolysaccharide/colanic/teichoic acid biosynthesis glycosyltransferase